MRNVRDDAGERVLAPTEGPWPVREENEGPQDRLTLLVRSGEGTFQQAPVANLGASLADPDDFLWLDIASPTEQAGELLATVFHFHPLTIEDCLSPAPESPKVDDYGHYLFIVAQDTEFNPTTEEVDSRELNLFVGPNFVVTSHHRRIRAVDDVRERCQRNAPVPARGPDWLAHAILDALVDDLLPAVDAIDEEMSRLQDEALRSPPRTLVRSMTQLKHSAIHLRRLVAPQRDMVNRLSRGDFSHLVRPETQMYYRDIYDHMVRVADMIETLRDLGDSVIATYLATVNNRLNEVMKILSVVSVIFLPLTLIASVFGTNFSPTYEDTGWVGFLVMIALMVLITLGLITIFRRARWF